MANNLFRLVTPPNWNRVINRKDFVLAVYPELADSYKKMDGCRDCVRKRVGKAILTHILNDPDLAKKNRKLLKYFLPENLVNNLGEKK